MGDTLLALAARVEAGTGPDRALDAAIWRVAIGRVKCRTTNRWHKLKRTWPVLNGLEWCFWFETVGGSMWGVPLIPYTASLDAALTLVPAGWDWLIRVDGRCRAEVDREDGAMQSLNTSTAASPARALTAAALRARAGEAAR